MQQYDNIEMDLKFVWCEADGLALHGHYKEAETLYTKLIETKHDLVKDRVEVNSTSQCLTLALAMNNRGHLKYLQVNFEGAIKDYSKALEIKPDMAVSYYNRGQVHYRMGRFHMAVKDFEMAVGLDPGFGDAQESLQQTIHDLQLASSANV